jgi:hypothetical protein
LQGDILEDTPLIANLEEAKSTAKSVERKVAEAKKTEVSLHVYTLTNTFSGILSLPGMAQLPASRFSTTG